MEKTKTLVLFDFDGTLTRKDTLLKFVIFTHGKLRFFAGMTILLPWLIAYKLNLYSNEKAKIRLLRYFYKNRNYGLFKRKGEEFCQKILPGIIRPSGLEKLLWHQRKNHRIIVVTASATEWVGPWCDQLNVEIVGTGLQVENNKLTGALSTPNCFGKEKVNRVKQLLNLKEYETIYAYGDSNGDKEMLNIATKPYFRYFFD